MRGSGCFQVGLSTGLVLLMVLQLMAPFAAQSERSESVWKSYLMQSIRFRESGTWARLGGQLIDLEGMTEVLVRQDSSIDMWMREHLFLVTPLI